MVCVWLRCGLCGCGQLNPDYYFFNVLSRFQSSFDAFGVQVVDSWCSVYPRCPLHRRSRWTLERSWRRRWCTTLLLARTLSYPTTPHSSAPPPSSSSCPRRTSSRHTVCVCVFEPAFRVVLGYYHIAFFHFYSCLRAANGLSVAPLSCGLTRSLLYLLPSLCPPFCLLTIASHPSFLLCQGSAARPLLCPALLRTALATCPSWTRPPSIGWRSCLACVLLGASSPSATHTARSKARTHNTHVHDGVVVLYFVSLPVCLCQLFSSAHCRAPPRFCCPLPCPP